MSEFRQSVSVAVPSKTAVERQVREIVRRGKGTLYIASMNEVPHGTFYADGEERYLANGANWDLIKFHRTGNAADDGEWVYYATSAAIVSWP